jgi:hypothetical protein
MSTFPSTLPRENVRDYQQKFPVIKSGLPVSVEVLCNVRANKEPCRAGSIPDGVTGVFH